MPSFKTAGKSKEDLIVVAQLAGLLTAEEAAGKTRLQLVRLINAASRKNEEKKADQKAVDKPAVDQDALIADSTSHDLKQVAKSKTRTTKRTAATAAAGTKTATKKAVRKPSTKNAGPETDKQLPLEDAKAAEDAKKAVEKPRKTASRKKTTRKASEKNSNIKDETQKSSKTDAADANEKDKVEKDNIEKSTRKTTRKKTAKTKTDDVAKTESKDVLKGDSKEASETESKVLKTTAAGKLQTEEKQADSVANSSAKETASPGQVSVEADKTSATQKDKVQTDKRKTDKTKTDKAESGKSRTARSTRSKKKESNTDTENHSQAARDNESAKLTAQDQANNHSAKENPVQQVIAKKAEEKQSVIKFQPKAPLTKKSDGAKPARSGDSEETSPEAAAAGLEQEASVAADQAKTMSENTQRTVQSGAKEKQEQPHQSNKPNHRNNQTAAHDGNRPKRPQVEAGEVQSGVLEIMPDGYGFLRRDNYLQGSKDIYVPPQYIRRFSLRQGDFVTGPVKLQRETDRYQAILYIKEVNGLPPEKMQRRPNFDKLTPIYPDERFILESTRNELSTRIIDLVAPIGKGQRGMIVSPPKAGKTILLQKIANAISQNNPEAKLIVLLIDERPEEVTDMQRSINGEVVYSTFDKTPENHTKVVELVLERAMRLVELGQDVVILLDSMTRLARAYNLTINPTGRTLSGGLDPGALYGPKRFFGAARNIENGGSLTIISTSLIETGSRMDEVIFEEFKGTGNMEVYLDRKLSEKRIFPAIDINKSGTRREDLLLTEKELDAAWNIRKAFSQLDTSAVTEAIIGLLLKTQNNEHFIASVNVSFSDKNLYDAMRGNKPGVGQQQNNNQSTGNGYKNNNSGSNGYR